jgi:hypothetical protein
MNMTKRERAMEIANTPSIANVPHGRYPGMRIVGWIVPEDVAGLSDALFAMDEIKALIKAGAEVLK